MNTIAESAFIDELEKIAGIPGISTVPRFHIDTRSVKRIAEGEAAYKTAIQNRQPDFFPHEEKFSRAIRGGHIPDKSGRTQVGRLYVDKP